MTLRLGFVGCGKWGRKLAESFRACGAEVVAHDRQNRERCRGHGTPLCDDGIWRMPGGEERGCVHSCDAGYRWTDGFGIYKPWREQLTDKSIDAIVAVAPPEITTEVALECARQGKAVLATKPLLDHPERISSVFYVDLWRLWADAHINASRGTHDFILSGAGPFRDFPGAFDYGPHAVAAYLDRVPPSLWPAVHVMHLTATESRSTHGELFDVELLVPDILGARLVFGNGDTMGRRIIWGEPETPTHIGAQPKDEVIQKMCRAFLSDVIEGFVDTRLLSLSREGMRLLNEIRAGAT